MTMCGRLAGFFSRSVLSGRKIAINLNFLGIDNFVNCLAIRMTYRDSRIVFLNFKSVIIAD